MKWLILVFARRRPKYPNSMRHVRLRGRQLPDARAVLPLPQLPIRSARDTGRTVVLASTHARAGGYPRLGERSARNARLNADKPLCGG